MHIPIRDRILISFLAIGVSLSLSMAIAQPRELNVALVVAKLQNQLQQAQGLSLEAELRFGNGQSVTARIMALRPNFYRVETENQAFFSDGSLAWQYFPLKASYIPYVKDDKGMSIPFALGFAMYSPPSRFKPDYTGIEETTFEGKRVIALAVKFEENPILKTRIFINPESWLPVGVDQKIMDDVTVFIYRNVRTDRRFTPADFEWAPPKGAVDLSKIKSDGPKPLQTGELAPEFDLPLVNGKHISLSKALEGKKGLLLNFWFINCSPCLSELPQLADLYRNAKDFEIIAINDIDTPDEIRKFLDESKYQFPFVVDKSARVAGSYNLKDYGRPISYLILPDRTVAYVQIGYDAEEKLTKLKEELVKLGIIKKTPRE